jgi:hypothetical protein
MIKMMKIERPHAGNNAALRESIYSGEIIKFAPFDGPLELVRAVRSRVIAAFGADCRNAQFRLPESEFLRTMHDLKKDIYQDEVIRRMGVQLLVQCGFNPSECVFDAPRVRAIPHNGHLSPLAAVAYLSHRDTWYANPQSQVNFWLPLHDVVEQETFSVFKNYFNKAVPNSSREFDYDRWTKEVGFGNSQAGNNGVYPVPDREIADDQPFPISAEEGEVLLFSAAHLHRTNRNCNGQTRFSIDFRCVHVPDYLNGKGAPNVDNDSIGSSFKDYVPCIDYYREHLNAVGIGARQ